MIAIDRDIINMYTRWATRVRMRGAPRPPALCQHTRAPTHGRILRSARSACTHAHVYAEPRPRLERAGRGVHHGRAAARRGHRPGGRHPAAAVPQRRRWRRALGQLAKLRRQPHGMRAACTGSRRRERATQLTRPPARRPAQLKGAPRRSCAAVAEHQKPTGTQRPRPPTRPCVPRGAYAP